MRDSIDILVPDGHRRLSIGGKVIAKVDLGNEAGPELFRLTISKLEDDRFWAEPAIDDPVGGIGGRWLKYDDFGKEWNLYYPKVKHRRPCNECKGMIEEGSERDVCEVCQSKLGAKLQEVAAQVAARRARVSILLRKQRHIGSLERYFGEYGRLHETPEAYFEWMNGTRLEGFRDSTVDRMRKDTEEIRLEMASYLFVGLLERLTRELEATR